MGKFKYEDFKSPKRCGVCHQQIYQEWEQCLMAKSFTHAWDDVEYFKLALPHAMKFAKVAEVKGGCIACHGPLAFLTGDIPPKSPAADTRANEGVSCEVCYNITGTTEKVPYNFSYTIGPGKIKQASRKGVKAPHGVRYSAFLRTSQFCATCHDEASPYGAWVKSTYREWKDVAPGSQLKFSVELFNGKVGHYIPSGSTEERMLWLEVWAVDSAGHKYSIPVDKKGFKGEEYTIADSKVLAYQAMGDIMNIRGFKGIKRDGDVPDGARIFRKPFLDPKGRMTICQWYAAQNTLVDYRIGRRETKVEGYTWNVPTEIAPGPVTIKAILYYSLVPSSVGEFLKLPVSEYTEKVVNTGTLRVKVEK